MIKKSIDFVSSKVGSLVAFFCAIVIAACSQNHDAQYPLLTVPLIRNEPQAIDLDFAIKESHEYALELSFRYPKGNEKERAKIKSLVAISDVVQSEIDQAKRLTLHVVVFKKSSDGMIPLLDETIEAGKLNVTSWSDNVFNKELVSRKFEPGVYHLSVDAIDVAGAMRSIDTDFRLVQPYRGK